MLRFAVAYASALWRGPASFLPFITRDTHKGNRPKEQEFLSKRWTPYQPHDEASWFITDWLMIAGVSQA
jgi:hypothetical protein